MDSDIALPSTSSTSHYQRRRRLLPAIPVNQPRRLLPAIPVNQPRRPEVISYAPSFSSTRNLDPEHIFEKETSFSCYDSFFPSDTIELEKSESMRKSPPVHRSPNGNERKSRTDSLVNKSESRSEEHRTQSKERGAMQRYKSVDCRTSTEDSPTGKFDRRKMGTIHGQAGQSTSAANDNVYYRVRSFSIINKKVVHLGSTITQQDPGASTPDNRFSFAYDPNVRRNKVFRVSLLGFSKVGRSSMISRFLTSEDISLHVASLSEDYTVHTDNTVCVNVNNEKTNLMFIDRPYKEMSTEHHLSFYKPDICVVVYSVTSCLSFIKAESILLDLTRNDYVLRHSVILVATKCDLARDRVISTKDGQELATTFNCKFIEISSEIHININELLVGVAKQIRLREKFNEELLNLNNWMTYTSRLFNIALVSTLSYNTLKKSCMNYFGRSNPCKDLHNL